MSRVTSACGERFGYRDHYSRHHGQLIAIIPESLIIFGRNTDHDHLGNRYRRRSESLITAPQNPHEVTETVNDWGFMRQRRHGKPFPLLPLGFPEERSLETALFIT